MSNPTASQKRFMAHMANLGCCVTGDKHNFQMHHVVGRSARVKYVGNIGHWYVLPILAMYHDVSSNHPCNVTHHKKMFEQVYGKQSELWLDRVKTLKEMRKYNSSIKDADLPTDEVIDAVINYRN